VAGREPSSPTPPPPGPIEPEEGAVYGYGRFVLRELLGRNDKGQTWLADDKLPSPANAPSQVVLKILPPGFPPKDEVTTLLRKEVPKAQRLVHPNIARVQSWHHRPGEPVFCVTEFVPGTHLRNHLAEHPSGRLSSAEVEPLLAQLVSALDFAHTQAGVVHHNLHLGNLYLTPDQQLKVADFQLDLPSPSRSLPAHVLPYASPQKQRGDPATMADDLYAVGAILYHLVTGQPPFAAEQLASGGSAGPARDPRTIRASPLGSPCPISDAAALTLLRCLSRDPLQRPPDAQTLRSWWYFGPPSEEPPQPPPPDPSLLTRTIATLGVMLALLIGVPLLLQSKELQTGLESLVTRFRRLVVQPRPDAAFRIHELRSAESLAKRLGDPTNNIATYLRTRLGPDTLRLLGAWQPDQPLPPRFPTMLLADLNQVVRGESIWDAIRFEGVSLRESTERTLKSKRDEASLPRLNRLLLEDAFPAELTTNAPVPSDDGNGSRGPRDAPHPGTAFRVWVRGVETFDVEAILYQDSPTATDPNRQERLWSNKVPVGKPTIVALAETNAANCSFEAGLGTRHARTWLRMEARSAPGTTQDVVLDFAKHTWELAVTQPLPIELFDHWNNRLVVIDTNRFVLNERPNRDRFPWRMDYSTVRELALHPGNYSVRVLDEAANARRMEATRKPFRIGGSGLVEVELAIEPWRHPHLGHSWAIPRLGLELVPIGGSGGFLAGKTETSVAQFAAFAKETGLIPETLWSIGPNGSERGSRDWRDPFGLDNPNLPVVGVSWHEAIRYCEWLTESERRAGRLTARQRFALPTDAQWSQYGGTNKYPWGETFPPRRVHGVYATSSLRNEPWWPKAWEDFYVGTADEAHPPRVVPVHLGPVGPHGLVNVGGNVAEWCGSAFVASMYRATDWTIPSERLRRASSQDGYKTVRGASWFDHDPDMLRTETRWAELPDTRNDRIGFRIVLVQDP
ncbi:MAG: SUMF1/EgtB/PvdO family nonheme iron enzyme, partial [Verrucomicrobiales bacterium]|nr:SUMF1/EgtB/PvdO family nonheme iron enzyme [Verrucomicrobiales bacterium]